MAADKSTFQMKLGVYQYRANAYKGSWRSGNDDAIYGDYGFYTAGKEKAYLSKMVNAYMQALIDWPTYAKSATIDTFWGMVYYFSDEKGTDRVYTTMLRSGKDLTAWKREHKDAIKGLA